MYNISSNSSDLGTHRRFPFASPANFFCAASRHLNGSKYEVENRYSCSRTGAKNGGLAGLGRMFTVDRLSRRLLYQRVCVVPAVCRVAGTDGAGQNPSTKIQQHTPPTPGGDRRQAFTSFNFIGLRAFPSRRNAPRFPVLEPIVVTPAPRKSPSTGQAGAAFQTPRSTRLRSLAAHPFWRETLLLRRGEGL